VRPETQSLGQVVGGFCGCLKICQDLVLGSRSEEGLWVIKILHEGILIDSFHDCSMVWGGGMGVLVGRGGRVGRVIVGLGSVTSAASMSSLLSEAGAGVGGLKKT
jgi:hypothetical protein